MSIPAAATYPERVDGLVLVGTHPRVLSVSDYPAGMSAEQFDVTVDRIAGLWGGPVGLQIFLPSTVGDARFSEWWARFLRMKYVELGGVDQEPFGDNANEILDEIEIFVTGTRHEPDMERTLATLMFTDIVDATRKAAELGDRRWRDLLDAHYAIVRQQLSRFRGRELDTAGDGVLASFDGPARAIRAGCAIRDRIRSLGVEVRIGLHTGECEVMGSKLSGIALHIGARIAALAGPGDVFVSSTVRDLVGGSGLSFREQGQHELKGVPGGEWRVFEVVSP
jgi:class 3 adenylate cyclase